MAATCSRWQASRFCPSDRRRAGPGRGALRRLWGLSLWRGAGAARGDRWGLLVVPLPRTARDLEVGDGRDGDRMNATEFRRIATPIATLPPAPRGGKYLWCDGCLSARPDIDGVCRQCGGLVCQMVGEEMLGVGEKPTVQPQLPLPPEALAGFAPLLRHYRDRVGLTQWGLARWAGTVGSHIGRLENGSRHPGRETVSALADAFALNQQERHGFFVAAGYAPDDLMAIGWSGDFEQLLAWKRRHEA
jgi:hypothetical protein